NYITHLTAISLLFRLQQLKQIWLVIIVVVGGGGGVGDGRDKFAHALFIVIGGFCCGCVVSCGFRGKKRQVCLVTMRREFAYLGTLAFPQGKVFKHALT